MPPRRSELIVGSERIAFHIDRIIEIAAKANVMITVTRNRIPIKDGRASIRNNSSCVASANHAPLPIIAITVPKAVPILAILRNSSGNRAITIDAPPINVSRGAFTPLPTGIRSVAHAAKRKYSSAPIRSQSRILLEVILNHHIHTAIHLFITATPQTAASPHPRTAASSAAPSRAGCRPSRSCSRSIPRPARAAPLSWRRTGRACR